MLMSVSSSKVQASRPARLHRSAVLSARKVATPAAKTAEAPASANSKGPEGAWPSGEKGIRQRLASVSGMDEMSVDLALKFFQDEDDAKYNAFVSNHTDYPFKDVDPKFWLNIKPYLAPHLLASGSEPSPTSELLSTADPALSKEDIELALGLFSTWNAALATGDPETVADLYAPNAVLLPTVSNQARIDKAGLVNYFTAFLKLQPQGVIDQYGIRLEATDAAGNPSVISNSGIYTFTSGVDGAQISARYTYVYTKLADGWKILHHHSSKLPSQLVPSAFTGEDYLSASTSDEGLTDPEAEGVKAAFAKWNAALQTLDPEAVVACYADDAILLPTVADDVRTTKASRHDYFVNFLQKKPEGALDECHVRLMGRDALGLPNAASIQGIYTFLMKATGDKVQARYSYIYVREGDEWLIKVHHSSAMPEATSA